jgi:hypothetical protein
MKKFVLTALAVVVFIVLVGYSLLANMGAGLFGEGSTYYRSPDALAREQAEVEAQREAERACDGDGAKVTLRFARHVGRPIPVPGGAAGGWGDELANPDQGGCMVWVEVPKTPEPMFVDRGGSDYLPGVGTIVANIDDTVRPLGGKQTRPESWVNRNGFKVRAVLEIPVDDIDDPAVTVYTFPLYGRSVD